MSEFRQHYEITADSKKFESAVNSSIKIAAKFSQSMGGADKQVRGFNAALGRFVGPSGKMISNLTALNSVGAITSKQYKELIKIYDALEKKYQGDLTALAGIASARRSLNSSIGLEVASRKRLRQEQDQQLSLEQRLNAVGIQTTAQFNRRIESLRQLAVEAAGDVKAMQQVEMALAQLRDEMAMLDQAAASQQKSTKLSQFTLLNFGFAVQDASTFSQGFAFGLRSIANNLDGVLRSFGELVATRGGVKNAFKQLALDIKSPGGLIVMLNLLTTATVVLFEVFNKRGKELDEITKKSKDLTASLIKLRSGMEGISFSPSVTGLEEAVEVGERLLDATAKRLELVKRIRDTRAVAAGYTATTEEEKAEFQGVSTEDLDKEYEQLENRSTRLTETLRNQSEMLGDQVAYAQQLGIMREQGLDKNTRLQEVMQEQVNELTEQLQIEQAMTALSADGLRTGEEALAFMSREVQLRIRGNELRKEAAETEARILSLARELGQAREKGGTDARNAVIDERVKLEEEIAGILVRQTAAMRRREEANAVQAGQQATLKALLDDQLDVVKELAAVEKERETISTRIAIEVGRLSAARIKEMSDQRVSGAVLADSLAHILSGAEDATIALSALNGITDQQITSVRALKDAEQARLSIADRTQIALRDLATERITQLDDEIIANKTLLKQLELLRSGGQKRFIEISTGNDIIADEIDSITEAKKVDERRLSISKLIRTATRDANTERRNAIIYETTRTAVLVESASGLALAEGKSLTRARLRNDLDEERGALGQELFEIEERTSGELAEMERTNARTAGIVGARSKLVADELELIRKAAELEERRANAAEGISNALQKEKQAREEAELDAAELNTVLQDRLAATIAGERDHLLLLEKQNEELRKALGLEEKRKTDGYLAYFLEKYGDYISGFQQIHSAITGIANDNFRNAQDKLRKAEDDYNEAIKRQEKAAKDAAKGMKDISNSVSIGFQQISDAASKAARKQAKDSLRAYKASAISEAIINALLAGSQVWASRMPLPAKIVASAAVVANGFRIVNQIRRVSIDGGGGGSSGGGGGGIGDVFQKERAELFLGGLQPGPDSVLPLPSGRALLPGSVAPGVAPGSSSVTLNQAPVEVNITPSMLPSGAILFSVERGLEQRASIGLSRTIQVPA